MASDQLVEIEKRVLSLWKWDSPSQGIEYHEGPNDPEEVEAFEDCRYGNGQVTELTCLPPVDVAFLLAEIKRLTPVYDAACVYTDAFEAYKSTDAQMGDIVRACRKARE